MTTTFLQAKLLALMIFYFTFSGAITCPAMLRSFCWIFVLLAYGWVSLANSTCLSKLFSSPDSHKFSLCQVVFISSSSSSSVPNLMPSIVGKDSEDKILKCFVDKLLDVIVLQFSFFTTKSVTPDHQNFGQERILKYRPHCKLIIVPLFSDIFQPPLKLRDMLKGVYNSNFLQKDKDYFIFLSASTHTSSLTDLLTNDPEVSLGIKNKVGATLVPGYAQVDRIYSNCPYCDKDESTVVQHSNEGPLFPDFLDNFYGKIITVSSPVVTKSVLELRWVDGDWENTRGVLNFAVSHVFHKYNITGKYIPTNATGVKFPNSTWNGAMGDVLSGKADMGQCVGRILSRNKVVEFSFPVIYIWMTFSTGPPQPHYSWKATYYPFGHVVWILICASILVTMVTLKFLVYLIPGVTCGKNLSYMGRSFFEQATSSIMKRKIRKSIKVKDATRVFLSFWLLFCLVIVNSYKSKLVSFLLFPLVEEPPKTFQDLSATTEHRLALHYLEGAAFSILKYSKHPTFHKIFLKMTLERNEVRCFQRVLEEPKFVCISWNAVADYVKYKNVSDQHGNSPVIQSPERNSPYTAGLHL